MTHSCMHRVEYSTDIIKDLNIQPKCTVLHFQLIYKDWIFQWCIQILIFNWYVQCCHEYLTKLRYTVHPVINIKLIWSDLNIQWLFIFWKNIFTLVIVIGIHKCVIWLFNIFVYKATWLGLFLKWLPLEDSSNNSFKCHDKLQMEKIGRLWYKNMSSRISFENFYNSLDTIWFKSYQYCH